MARYSTVVGTVRGAVTQNSRSVRKAEAPQAELPRSHSSRAEKQPVRKNAAAATASEQRKPAGSQF